MKKENRILALLLFAFLMFGLLGCSSIEDKIAEKATEKIVEGATGAQVDVDKGSVKVEGEGGSFEAGQDMDWPQDAMGDLPEPKAAVTGVIKAGAESCTVTFTEMVSDDAKEYIAALTELGYKDGMNIADQESLMLAGTKDDGSSVSFIYNITAKEGTVTYTKAAQ
ncbi:hypothetical protein [Phosphitispora fastidiosa]|uniref:hypothetical protein n=1 Tax=Phosphitispora fastidiosa TaxID=2837202 RepID=UPI001E5D57FB|nr:hypothetical protein [Phosphitispora fastidiosa]MBU7006511.1 hypothetical protein [Phosphitispora fastidiosa]